MFRRESSIIAILALAISVLSAVIAVAAYIKQKHCLDFLEEEFFDDEDDDCDCEEDYCYSSDDFAIEEEVAAE